MTKTKGRVTSSSYFAPISFNSHRTCKPSLPISSWRWHNNHSLKRTLSNPQASQQQGKVDLISEMDKWTGCRGDDIISLLWTIVRRNKFPRVKGPHILLCIEVFGSKSFHNKKLIHERKDFQLLHCWRLFALHIVNYLRKKLLVSLSTLHKIWANICWRGTEP